jgi:hypothetical protein
MAIRYLILQFLHFGGTNNNLKHYGCKKYESLETVSGCKRA